MMPELIQPPRARVTSDAEHELVARRLRDVTATVAGGQQVRRRREELTMFEARQRLRALAAEVDAHALIDRHGDS